MKRNDVIIIGAGLVGLATAYHLSRRLPHARIVVLEKEARVAAHQSGHNSGVLHTGMYYVPGSEKARGCRRGLSLMEAFAQEHGIPHRICGKVIVATCEEELPQLQRIFERGQQNGVRCRMACAAEINEIEPHVRAIRGIIVEESGVIDYPAVAEKLRELIEERGGEVRTGFVVREGREFTNEVVLAGESGEVRGGFLVAAAGLYADQVLRGFGHRSPVTIVPFRGEYYLLRPERTYLCQHLIYPVPNPQFPFLGVHFTRGVYGDVECGPNAVLALSREGYRWGAIHGIELARSLLFPGLHRFLLSHWRDAAFELARSASKRLFVAALRRLIPEIKGTDLTRGPSGVRAQAMLPEGTLVDDFMWYDTPRAVHVLNAPSPAATSCLSIGETVATRVIERIGAPTSA